MYRLKFWDKIRRAVKPSSRIDRKRKLLFDCLEDRTLCAIAPITSWSEIPTTDAGTNQNYGDVAMFADGGYVAVWQDSGSIYRRQFDARGIALSNQTTVASANSGVSFATPSVGVAENGSIVVAYTMTRADTNYDEDVWYSYYSISGGIESEVTGMVNSPDTTHLQNSPDVAMDDAGNFVIAYRHEYSDTDDDVYYRLYLGGVASAATSVPGAGGSHTEYRHSAAISDDGSRFAIAWQENDDTNGMANVRFTMYGISSGSSSVIVSDQSVPDSGVGTIYQVYPAIAMDRDGDAMIAWQENTEGKRIRVRTFYRTGQAAGASFDIATATAGISSPEIAVGLNAGQDYAVVYQSTDSNGNGDVRVGGRFHDTGSFNLPVSEVSTYHERLPNLALTGEHFVVSYIERLSGSSDDDFLAMHFGSEGSAREGNDIGGFIGSTGGIFVSLTNYGAIPPFATTHYAGAWSTSVTWKDMLVADFSGDGFDDLAGRVNETGQWWVQQDSAKAWTTWAPTAGWRDVQVADVNGDHRADLVGRTAQGQWWAAISTGTSFTNVYLGAWHSGLTWVDVKVADVNGDGRDDLLGRSQGTGQWWAGISNGASITNALWTSWSTSVTWVDVRVGDFDGNGLSDIAGRVQQAGQWWVGLSNGAGFINAYWTSWSTGVVWKDVMVGDFDGNGRDDIAGRVSSNGAWWVGISTTGGTGSFVNQFWGTWSPSINWNHVRVGDFNSDGRTDLLGWDPATGAWWVSLSNGKQVKNFYWGQWSRSVTWTVVQVGNFS